MTDKAKIIATRKHPKLQAKLPVWKLIYDAYTGGSNFINEDNLQQQVREETTAYKRRLERADYTNHTQQLIDQFVGYIYTNPVKRVIDPKYSYINDSIYRGKSLQSLMDSVSTNCLKGTVGILIDSPALTVVTEADRISNNIHPYAVVYAPDKINDFDIDDKGELLWITLNNDYIDKSDPTAEPVEVKTVRLWTRSYYRDVKITKDDQGEIKYIAEDEIPHGLGKIPFIFVNCRDAESDYICDSPFEDVVLKSRTIFNYESWANGALGASSFQILVYPYVTQEDAKEIESLFDPTTGSIWDIYVYPYSVGSSSAKPDFIKPDNSIDDHIKMIELLTEQINNKFGLKTDSKGSWESGVAKSIDFSKTEAFLKPLSLQLQETERKIVEYCAMYEQKDITYSIEYASTYEKSDMNNRITQLSTMLAIGSKTLQTKVQMEMINQTFPGMDQSEMDTIRKELEATAGLPDL